MSIRNWFSSRLAALWERQSRIKDLDRELESPIWNWNQKSNRNPACHSRKHVMPLDELSQRHAGPAGRARNLEQEFAGATCPRHKVRRQGPPQKPGFTP